MTAIQLYKFLTDNGIEYHWHNEDVILFINNWQIEDFYKLITQKSATVFGDEGINCTMKDGYFAFWMKDICEHFDIEMEEVFKKENTNV